MIILLLLIAKVLPKAFPPIVKAAIRDVVTKVTTNILICVVVDIITDIIALADPEMIPQISPTTSLQKDDTLAAFLINSTAISEPFTFLAFIEWKGLTSADATAIPIISKIIPIKIKVINKTIPI